MKFDDNELYSIPSSVNGTQCSLHDLAKWKNGLAFKKINFSDEGVPVIKISELNNGIGPKTAYTKEIFSEDVHLKRGDLLFSWSGNPQTSIDTFRFDLEEGWLNQHIFKLTPNEKLVDFDYFYFLMKNLKPYFTKIATNKQTTGLGHVTLADIKRMNLIVPDVETQKRIVSVIKPIDDKIKLNNDINKNLEQQLHILFIKIFNGISTDVNLGDVVDTTSGGTPSRKHTEYYENGSICWVKSKELLGNYILDTEEHINDIALSKSSAKLLPSHSVLIAMYGATVGAHGIISKSMACNQAVCALLCNKKYPYTYLFQIAQEQQQKLINMAVGSAQQNISQILIKQLPLHSDISSIRKFHDLALPLHKQIEELQAENRALSKMRDTLLPQLMSGELDVSDIDL